MTDSEIVMRFIARDEAAVASAREKYGERLMALAKNITGDNGIAEECVSDALFTAWNSIPPNEPHEYLLPYLCRIVRNTAVSRMRAERANKRSAAIVELTHELEECLPSPASVEDEAAGNELKAFIARFVEGLPEEKRSVFVLRYWYFESVEAIAKKRGISLSKVKTLLHRTRKELKKLLEKNGYEV